MLRTFSSFIHFTSKHSNRSILCQNISTPKNPLVGNSIPLTRRIATAESCRKNTMDKIKEPVCLVVIDGWGISEEKHGNAIVNAETPVMDRLTAGNNMNIEAHGRHVGLPTGLMGNSEVGHLNIGAGRVIYQDIVRITLDVENDKIKENPSFVNACNNAKSGNGRLHLLGLVSDGGVHAHIDHLIALLKGAKFNRVQHLFIHFFSDGRDTSPNSGVTFIQQVLDTIAAEKYGSLSTIMGRYYAMDRDKRWERIQLAYEGLVGGRGQEATADNIIQIVKNHYANNVTDEFLKPIILNKEGCIKDNDTMLFIDFRSDRMRQISETFGIKRHFKSDIKHPEGLNITTFTQYNQEFPFPVLYPPVSHKNVLAEALSKAGLSQYHCAETEKYAHVTFFFNGGREEAFKGEDRCMVPSPKVATYDLKPEMSAAGVADKMIETVALKKYPFVMCNFAPPDMVGHTGQYEPAVLACAATDKAIGRIEKACAEHGYVMLVTADHGNAEKMIAPDGGKHTAHTCNVVPFCSTGKRQLKKAPTGRNPALCDVATTVLDLLGVEIPRPDMTGASLLE